MQQLTVTVKNFVILYFIMTIIFQVVGNSDMNRYLRFFGGVMMMLILLSPAASLFTGRDIAHNIKNRWTYQKVGEEMEFETLMQDYLGKKENLAISLLIQAFDESLKQLGYEVKQYESKQDIDGNLIYVDLYVGEIGKSRMVDGRFSENAACAVQCQELLMQEWEPEFELRVYGKDE